jgi:hypothetical protein
VVDGLFVVAQNIGHPDLRPLDFNLWGALERTNVPAKSGSMIKYDLFFGNL